MADRPRGGPLASPGYHLWTASLGWAAAVSRALAPLELTHVQFFVLGSVGWLGRGGQAPKQSDITAFTAMDPMMVSKVVRALEDRGLLTRDDDPADARAWRLRLTPAGKVAVREAAALVRQVDARFFGPLGRRRAPFVDELRSLHRRAR